MAGPPGPVKRPGIVAAPEDERQPASTICGAPVIDLRTPWQIGRVEVPTRLVLAPMAGVTNYPFRAVCRRFGAGLYVSEMINARPLVDGIVEVYTAPRGGKNPGYANRQDYAGDELVPLVIGGAEVGTVAVRAFLR